MSEKSRYTVGNQPLKIKINYVDNVEIIRRLANFNMVTLRGKGPLLKMADSGVIDIKPWLMQFPFMEPYKQQIQDAVEGKIQGFDFLSDAILTRISAYFGVPRKVLNKEIEHLLEIPYLDSEESVKHILLDGKPTNLFLWEREEGDGKVYNIYSKDLASFFFQDNEKSLKSLMDTVESSNLVEFERRIKQTIEANDSTKKDQ